jgi:hypothetical protein
MPFWGWIVAGALLLGAETVVDAQFYLVFLGSAAVLTGGVVMLSKPFAPGSTGRCSACSPSPARWGSAAASTSGSGTPAAK